MTFLIERHANVNAQDINNRTALHFAAQAFSGPIFRALLDGKAILMQKDHFGQTPLDMVMEHIGLKPLKRGGRSRETKEETHSLRKADSIRSGASATTGTSTFGTVEIMLCHIFYVYFIVFIFLFYFFFWGDLLFCVLGTFNRDNCVFVSCKRLTFEMLIVVKYL